jgi:hypothetical protein
LTTLGSPLVTVGTLTNGFGDDLTSCSFPLQVLASHWLEFKASNTDYGVSLHWKIDEEEITKGYDIEYSKDGEHWQLAGHLAKDDITSGVREYDYLYKAGLAGRNYFRIAETTASGRQSFSSITIIDIGSKDRLFLGPNPVKEELFLNNANSARQLARIYDNYGRLVLSSVISQGQQSLNVQHLPKGIYVLEFQTSGMANDRSKIYRFMKW